MSTPKLVTHESHTKSNLPSALYTLFQQMAMEVRAAVDSAAEVAALSPPAVAVCFAAWREVCWPPRRQGVAAEVGETRAAAKAERLWRWWLVLYTDPAPRG
jgi:hypothetical protein